MSLEEKFIFEYVYSSKPLGDPDILLAMSRLAVSLSEIIERADYYGRPKEKEEAWMMMDRVLDDVWAMLEGSPRLEGRYPKLPKTFEENIEDLRVARDIEFIVIELLLKEGKHPTEHREARLKRAENILDALKFRINMTKEIVMERWKGKWAPELDAEFEKVLNFKI